ncbi:MAG: GNAT family N-acetyltransferase [Thermoplasmata archaeon]|nr:GNAT family N-acetyltransferase [Thermoplasmata archaeon]
MPVQFRTPVELQGRYVWLLPLSLEHVDGLRAASDDPTIWEFTRAGDLREPEAMRRWVENLLAQQRDGLTLAFVQVESASCTPLGMTRFLTIDREESHVEIGGTWLGRRWWNTPVNTESKLLLLRYAFDVEACHRVEFKTDLRNLRSQRAIERLGAVREGITREHILLPKGLWRTSVRYGIVASEWPAVRARLDTLLERAWPGPAQ